MIGIIMGSESDRVVIEEAEKQLDEFGIAYDTIVSSAHRNPENTAKWAKEASSRFKVVIAAAGKAAHLPGVVAGHTTLPVIGVPIKTSDLGGLDSLLSIVQMPKGVPVATVAINGAKNAAILAAQIVGTSDEKVAAKLVEYKETLKG